MELCDSSRFEIGELIGSGSYGSVHRARDLVTKRTVVVKQFKCDDESHYKELEVMAICTKPPNSFPVPVGYFYRKMLPTPNCPMHVCVAMEKFDCNINNRRFFVDMEKWKAKAGTWWSPEIKRTFQQLLTAVDFLHSNNIIHCDISLANILYSRKQKE